MSKYKISESKTRIALEDEDRITFISTSTPNGGATFTTFINPKFPIKENPIKFLATAPLGLLRLNAPLHYNGQELTHLFYGTHGGLPLWLKIGITAAIRGMWFIFLGIALYGLFAKIFTRDARWFLLAFFIVYYNIMHALFTHAEARYILTMLPLYFLFFAEGFRRMMSKTIEG